VRVQDGVARTESGSLAGSTLTLDQAVRNMLRFAGISINQAVAMATSTPAAAIGISDRKGAIRPGLDADIVFLDQDLAVQAAIVQGKLVYQSPSLIQRN
jgi:N-acetylglucosamine-6-phosphate deacetylase